MKSVILTHSDTDGICAGALALARFPHSRIFFTKPVSFFHDLQECKEERMVICDIAIDTRDERNIMELMESRARKGVEILYFDHHGLSKRTKRRLQECLSVFCHDTSVSSSELIYRHFRNEIPGERVWMSIYGAIGDYTDNTEFVEKTLLNWDMRAIYLEACTLVMGIKEDSFESYDGKRRIVQRLAKGDNPSDIEGLMRAAKEAVNREFDIYEIVKKHARKSGDVGYFLSSQYFGFRGPIAIFASNVTNTRIGLCVYSRKNHMDITMRTRDYSIPLADVAKKAAGKLGGSGGGHNQAAGARIPPTEFKEFLKEVNRLIRVKP